MRRALCLAVITFLAATPALAAPHSFRGLLPPKEKWNRPVPRGSIDLRMQEMHKGRGLDCGTLDSVAAPQQYLLSVFKEVENPFSLVFRFDHRPLFISADKSACKPADS